MLSDKKKCILKYINSKRKSEENIGPVLVKDGHLTNRDDEQRPWTIWSLESVDHKCRDSDLLFVDTEIVRDQLYQGSDGIHPRVLRKLMNVMAGTLSISLDVLFLS